MASPTFRSSTGLDVSNPSTLSISQPSGSVSSDIVLLGLFTKVTSGGSYDTWSAPSGWNQLSGSPWEITLGGSNFYSFQAFWASGNVNYSQTFSKVGTNSCSVGAVCEAWQNVNPSNPINVIGPSGEQSGTSISVSSITTTVDGCREIILAGDFGGGQFSATGFTKVENSTSVINQSCALLYATGVTSPAGATGPVTLNDSTTSAIMVVPFALQPPSSSVYFNPSASSTLVANGRIVTDGKSSSVAISAETVNGRIIADGKTPLTSTSSLDAAVGINPVEGNANLRAVSSLLAAGRILADGKSSLSDTTSLSASGNNVRSSASLNLFLNAVAASANNFLPLYLNASASGVNAAADSLSLFVDGNNEVDANLNLYLRATNTGISQNHLNLYAKGTNPTASNSLPLFARNTLASQTGILPLHISGTGYLGNASGTLNLFIQRWPTASLPLFAKAANMSTSGTMPLYTAGAGVGTGILPLVMPKTFGAENANIPLWTCGMPSATVVSSGPNIKSGSANLVVSSAFIANGRTIVDGQSSFSAVSIMNDAGRLLADGKASLSSTSVLNATAHPISGSGSGTYFAPHYYAPRYFAPRYF